MIGKEIVKNSYTRHEISYVGFLTSHNNVTDDVTKFNDEYFKKITFLTQIVSLSLNNGCYGVNQRKSDLGEIILKQQKKYSQKM